MRPDDIAELRVDDAVRLKMDAYPFQKHGTVKGRVLHLSPDAFSRQGPLGTQLDLIKGPARLLPGMTLNAEVRTGQRSVMSYFLYPIIRTLDESFRER